MDVKGPSVHWSELHSSREAPNHMASDIDTPRFPNEEVIRAGLKLPKGNGPHSIRALSGEAIYESVFQQIRERKEKGQAPPAWAIKHREPGDSDYYEQLV